MQAFIRAMGRGKEKCPRMYRIWIEVANLKIHLKFSISFLLWVIGLSTAVISSIGNDSEG
jgi:hypothetical protein